MKTVDLDNQSHLLTAEAESLIGRKVMSIVGRANSLTIRFDGGIEVTVTGHNYDDSPLAIDVNKIEASQSEIPKMLNHSETVAEIDWLINHYPGNGKGSFSNLDSEYGFRVRCIYNSIDTNAGLIVGRCLGGMMAEDGFTVLKLKEYWDSTVGILDDERLYNFRTVQWWNKRNAD